MRLARTLSAAAALLAALALGAPEAPAQAPVKVKQAGFKVMDMAMPFVAKAEGFFEKNGLDWEYVEIDSGKLGAAALLSGNAQFTDFAVDDVATLQKEGKDPILIYSMVNALTMDLVARNDVLERLKVTPATPLPDKLRALKGLTFGITRPGAVTQLFPSYLLRKAGFDPEKDATFVQIGGGQALVAAMKARRIDAFMLSAPAPYLLERDKVGTVIVKNSAGEGPPEFGDFAFTCIAVLRSWAEKNPRVVEGYTRALNQAYDWMVANRPAALAHLQKSFPETDEATLRISFEALVPAIRKGGQLTKAAIENQVQVMKAIGAVQGSPDTSEGVLWTNRYNR
jgi:ABC-type nitrate/sulfonate/bicarbonate transport system substrate-binding protein